MTRRTPREVARLILWREMVTHRESPVEYDLGSETFAAEVMKEMARLVDRLGLLVAAKERP